MKIQDAKIGNVYFAHYGNQKVFAKRTNGQTGWNAFFSGGDLKMPDSISHVSSARLQAAQALI